MKIIRSTHSVLQKNFLLLLIAQLFFLFVFIFVFLTSCVSYSKWCVLKTYIKASRLIKKDNISLLTCQNPVLLDFTFLFLNNVHMLPVRFFFFFSILDISCFIYYGKCRFSHYHTTLTYSQLPFPHHPNTIRIFGLLSSQCLYTNYSQKSHTHISYLLWGFVCLD